MRYKIEANYGKWTSGPLTPLEAFRYSYMLKVLGNVGVKVRRIG